MQSNNLMEFYQALRQYFGAQQWWPGETAFEVMVGAVLTQNTNWVNVEKAIVNLKKAGALQADTIHEMTREELAELIRPAGYFNVKAKRLKNLVAWLCDNYQGLIDNLKELSVPRLREELLAVNGVGRETADSIILYALEKPTFVVDAYTYRIFTRHQCIEPDCDYEQMKDFFEYNLPEDEKLYNEYHALIVQAGKNFCKPKPKCDGCPLCKFEHELGEVL